MEYHKDDQDQDPAKRKAAQTQGQPGKANPNEPRVSGVGATKGQQDTQSKGGASQGQQSYQGSQPQGQGQGAQRQSANRDYDKDDKDLQSKKPGSTGATGSNKGPNSGDQSRSPTSKL